MHRDSPAHCCKTDLASSDACAAIGAVWLTAQSVHLLPAPGMLHVAQARRQGKEQLDALLVVTPDAELLWALKRTPKEGKTVRALEQARTLNSCIPMPPSRLPRLLLTWRSCAL